MNQVIYFYLPSESMNDATEYYVGLLRRGFEESGHLVKIEENLVKIKRESIVLTIRGLDQIKIKNSPRKLINWFQGVGPEEYLLLHNFSFKSKLISKYLEILEKKALKKSNLCLFVSDAMKNHYERKYKLDLTKKSIVIPCYNIELEERYLQKKYRYSELNFVYAGGIFAWQCIDETLLIFKEIYKQNNSAKLTLLTGDKEKALELIKKYQIDNITIDYIKLKDLQDKLSQFTYGFLYRKDDVINNVSTPTKMNSYLAAGLIPIYTDVIESFEENVNLGDFELKFKVTDSFEKIAEKILKFHVEKEIDNNFLDIYNNIFENYYNDKKYIKTIKDYIIKNGNI